jgi:TnpA family transposase
MQRWRQQYLGLAGFPPTMASAEIDQFFTFNRRELTVIARRRGSLNRLSVGLQIGFLRMTGRTVNSFQILPIAVLKHLGVQLRLAPPRLASIRALYRRQRTLFDHQRIAMKVLGFRHLTDHAERGLTAHLRRSAEATFSGEALTAVARVWLYEHSYVLPGDRRVADVMRAALRHAEQTLSQHITAQFTTETAANWVKRLTALREDEAVSLLEWLREPPHRAGRRDIAEHVQRAQVLRELGADDGDWTHITEARLYHYARAMLRRKPAALRRLREPRRTVELACFLRWQLQQSTDTLLDLADHRIADLWRAARDRVEATASLKVVRYRDVITTMIALVDDQSISDQTFRERVRAVAAPFAGELTGNRSAAIRQELSNQSRTVRPLLKQVMDVPLDLPAGHPLATALPALRAIYATDSRSLPKGAANPFPKVWSPLIECAATPEAALGAFEAATLMMLKRSLRNGSASTRQSLTYRGQQDILIPAAVWDREQDRLTGELGLPGSIDALITGLHDTLQASLRSLAAAVAEGVVFVEQDRLRIPRVKADPEPPDVTALRNEITAAIGPVQLPDLLVQLDSQVRFSWILLGRSPHNERELYTLYCALLAQGSNLSAADLARMVDGPSADSIGWFMRTLEEEGRLRQASDAVVDYLRSHKIASQWGEGLFVSSDMMSLEATRHLWSARLDPRRRTYAVGTYTHVLDQWPIIYDQPIVLNRRQAGAAIEGAMRQQHVELEKLAVDTHGFTYFAMALAKLLGFDLCPRLADLGDRKLFVPRGIEVPDVLLPITERLTLGNTVRRGWDSLVRIAASINGGWCSATTVLDLYGAAAKGDPAYECGNTLGKLLRTIYLCDLLSNPGFRHELQRVLNQGETVHELQRAIHNGPIGARHGRSRQELVAISGALTLLTNVVMAWNTAQMQRLAEARWGGRPPAVLARIAPVAFAHINLRGMFNFSLGTSHHHLIESLADPRMRRA